MILTKVSQTHFSNGKEILETKSFLKHDLVHYAIDKTLGIYNAEDPTTHTAEIEQLAGIMHSVYDTSIPNSRFIEGAENMFSAHGKDLPVYMNHEFIHAVRDCVNRLLDRYINIKTGESMQLP